MAQARLKVAPRGYSKNSDISSYVKVRRAALRIMAREGTCKTYKLMRLIREDTGVNVRHDYIISQLLGLPLMIDCESKLVFSEK